MDWRELEHRLRLHEAKGGKTSRRRQADRVRQLIAFSRARGARDPSQISRRHVWEWYEQVKAATTLRDRFYAARLLWHLLGRGDGVPRPRLPLPADQGEGEPAKPGEPRRGAPLKAQAGAVGDGAEGRRPGG